MLNSRHTQKLFHWTKDEHRRTFRKSCKCLSTPILTSSRSFKKPLNTGTKSPAVSWSPRMTASSWMENASVRRTFHWNKEMNKLINNFHLWIIWYVPISNWQSASLLDLRESIYKSKTNDSLISCTWISQNSSPQIFSLKSVPRYHSFTCLTYKTEQKIYPTLLQLAPFSFPNR